MTRVFRVLAKHPAQQAATVGVNGGASRVLAARGRDDRPGAAIEGAPQLGGNQAALVDRRRIWP